jgi:hypothetical protein
MQADVRLAFIFVHFFLRSGGWESYEQSEQLCRLSKLLELAPSSELSSGLHRKISGTLTASLQPVKPMSAAACWLGSLRRSSWYSQRP